MPSSSGKTPRDFLRVAFRHRHLCLLAATVFAVVAFQAVRYVPLEYTGMTKFERRTDVAGGTPVARDSESFETIKLTLIHELAGRLAVERVAQDLGLLQGLPHDAGGLLTDAGEMQKQDIVRKLQDDIKVRWEVRSQNVDLIAVEVTHSDPKLAQQIPNALVENYINYISDKIVKSLTGSRDFLEKRVTDCRGRLTELTNKRIEFETRHAGLMPESPGVLQERIQRCSADLDTLRRQRTAAEQKLTILLSRRQATTGPAASQPVKVVKGPNPELKRLKDRLRLREEELDTAVTLKHMTQKHPMVAVLKTKIAQLKSQIAKTDEEVVLQRVYSDGTMTDEFAADEAMARSDRDIIVREIERLEARLNKLHELMANFAPIRQEYVEMGEKISKQNDELTKWQARYTQVQMNLAAEVAKRRTHLKAVQAAQIQIRPSSPKLTVVLAFALIGGLGFGAGLVFLLNCMDRSIGTTEDAIKYFDVPIRGVISEINSRRGRVVNGFKRWLFRPIMVIVALAVLSVSMLNVVLWLKYPDYYKQWRADPYQFVSRRFSKMAKRF